MKKRRKIYFRADSGPQIGLGHITRSMALADMLNENFEIYFLVQEPSQKVINKIREVTENIVELPKTEDFLFEAGVIAKKYLTDKEVVVLDGYHFRTEYQKVIKSTNAKLVCIDDMHAWHFVADVVINHSGGVAESDYSCESYTRLFLGPEYALLRRPFLEIAKQRRRIEKIENVFICFGGIDPRNLTEKAVNACLEANVFKEIHVVVGEYYAYLEELKSLINKKENIFLYQDLNARDLCEVMQKCHLGLVPASSVSYECLATGMHLIVGYYVENQKGLYNYFVEKKIKAVGDFGEIDVSALKNVLIEFFENSSSITKNLVFQNRLNDVFDWLAI